MGRTDFHELKSYCPEAAKFGLLPFRFARFDGERVLLTNDVGDHALIGPTDFTALLAAIIHDGYRI